VNVHNLQMGGSRSSKSTVSILVKLVSLAGTGTFYVTRKNPRRVTNKIELRKYDPKVNKHVLFREQKMR
jgi:large subunit ribosomal protein L33